ncbi:MAG: hypothetical protein IJS60_04700, partial [Abditibacteriota bacterium]|nr:hypothetical protein [Abditibacteriota bacterium]
DFKLWLLGFVSGALMVLIIVFGYLLFTHSLKDMIYCYLIFNFKYTGSGPSSPLIVNMFKTMILLCGKTLITLPLIVLTLFNNYKNKIYIINLFYFVVSLLLISLKGIPSSKYAIVLLPSLILFCVFFYLNLEKLNFRDKARQIKFINILSVIFIFGSIMLCIFGVFHRLDMYSKRMPYSIDYLRSVNENSDVLVLTNDCGVNLLSDRQTHNKYPYQFPPVEFDNVLYDDFLQRFKDNPSDYVILEEKDKEMFGNFASMIKIYDYLCELSQAQVYKHIVYDHFEVFVLNKELIND